MTQKISLTHLVESPQRAHYLRVLELRKPQPYAATTLNVRGVADEENSEHRHLRRRNDPLRLCRRRHLLPRPSSSSRIQITDLLYPQHRHSLLHFHRISRLHV